MTAQEIDVDALASVVDDGGYVLDVRESDEYAEARIPGVHHMPMSTVPGRQDEIPRERPVYVVCAVGGRSRQVADYLEQLGVEAYNVDGGTMAWLRSGRPVESGDPPA